MVIIFSSALLPIVIVLLAQGTIPIPNHDKTLSNMDIRCIESLRISNFSEPTLHRQTQLYMLVQKYLPSSLITCIKAFCYVVVLICISNVLEGFIYWHTWSFIKRYWYFDLSTLPGSFKFYINQIYSIYHRLFRM